MSNTKTTSPEHWKPLGSHIVEMLPGVQHHLTTGFATTLGAYDAFSAEDGWEEHASDKFYRWKEGTVNGRRINVHPPVRPGDIS